MDTNKILIKKAHIIDPSSKHHDRVMDILIEDDVVKKVASSIKDGEAEVVEHKNLHISPGWFDLRVDFCDPGREEREDIESGINAALAGGFTSVAMSPQTSPAIDSKADIEYVYQRADGYPVNVYPYGSLSVGMKGEDLSEMYDMYQAGAIGFSHGKKPVVKAGLMKLALLYTKNFAPAIHVPAWDHSLVNGGHMHEGGVSTYLGIKGIPELAEEVAILRDIRLSDYAETPVHFMGISSGSAVNLLKNARKEGRQFSADVPVANLIFTDKELESYDSNYKTLPPLRSEQDRKALINALKKGIIEVVTSDHSPVDIENKKCEFDHADFGMIGLESCFGALGTLRDKDLDLTKIIELISLNPRKVLRLETPKVEEGSWCEFTLFDPDKSWSFEKKDIRSKSNNTPFIGKELKGKALGIVNNGMLVWLEG